MYILSYPKNELEEDVKVKCRSRLKGINTKAHMSGLKKKILIHHIKHTYLRFTLLCTEKSKEIDFLT